MNSHVLSLIADALRTFMGILVLAIGIVAWISLARDYSGIGPKRKGLGGLAWVILCVGVLTDIPIRAICSAYCSEALSLNGLASELAGMAGSMKTTLPELVFSMAPYAVLASLARRRFLGEHNERTIVMYYGIICASIITVTLVAFGIMSVHCYCLSSNRLSSTGIIAVFIVPLVATVAIGPGYALGKGIRKLIRGMKRT